MKAQVLLDFEEFQDLLDRIKELETKLASKIVTDQEEIVTRVVKQLSAKLERDHGPEDARTGEDTGAGEREFSGQP